MSKVTVEKSFLGSCDGKQITFGEFLNANKDKKPAESNTASTSIKPPTITEYDSDTAELGAAMNTYSNFQTSVAEEFGYGLYSASASVERIPVSPETIPDYSVYKRTANVPDKSCMICLKTGMNLERLQQHLFQFHSIVFQEDDFDIDKWYEAEEHWNGSPAPPSSESE